MSLDFKDQVVIITGAGGGLGKEYALAYAARGAKVVVNDLGGSLKGDANGSSKAADVVVEEIKSKGGVAVANYDSVEFGDLIVKTAIDSFGRIDIIINNAGILRDATFKNMTEKDFNLVLQVHLHGAYKLTKAAWPYLRNQKFGRIINTASPAGLYGNFGQVNYSTAKSALIGFGETLAKEGYKYNINCNIIAPLARSRMTEGLLPQSMLDNLDAKKIVPLVLYLTHKDTKVSNSIFELAAGFYSQIRWERSSGELFKINDDSFTPEAILKKYDSIFEFKDKPFAKVSYPTQLNDYNKIYEETIKLPKNSTDGVKPISLKGKTVLITGAGNGLGRSHALLFGKYGANVVVNDIQDPFKVVEEIKQAGGVAVGDKNNIVTNADGVIKTAIDAFGKIDILVNNAGILRDRSFLKMTDDEWFQVMNVHILATFRLSKLCWPIFIKNGGGVILNTTSTSGIYGNFGQANYAAAKSGILGFTKSLAIEGAKYGIKCNAIAPHAETSMTKTIFKSNEINKFNPDQISPLLIVLSSDGIKTSGEIFEIGAGWIGNTRLQRAKGAVCTDADVKPEFLRDHWNEVVDFSEFRINKSTKDSTMGIFEAVSQASGGDEDDDDDEDEDEDEDEDSGLFKYTERDSILYNLGIGAKADELKYVFEQDEGFEVLPTFGVIPFMTHNDGGLKEDELLQNLNPALLLHGEQYLEIKKFPVPTSGELITKSYAIKVENKGPKAAIVVGGYKTLDKSSGEEIFYNESTTFFRGAQAKKSVSKPRKSFASDTHVAPKGREADFVKRISIPLNQAAIYRLSGDRNPLHIDTKFAQKAGFPKPILHGLSTFGSSVKELYEQYGRFDKVKVRFTNVVFPGERLEIKAWKVSQEKVVFEVWSVERKVAVISNAAIGLAGQAKL